MTENQKEALIMTGGMLAAEIVAAEHQSDESRIAKLEAVRKQLSELFPVEWGVWYRLPRKVPA